MKHLTSFIVVTILILTIAVSVSASGLPYPIYLPVVNAQTPRLADCIPPDAEIETVQVLYVVDGDTIQVLRGGREQTLRYIGMDTPEQNSDLVEDYGPEATARNKELVGGKKTVTIVKDVSETDPYRRLLRYVFVDDIFVNYQLVREGLADATVKYSPNDTACYNYFLEAQRLAKEDGVGMWSYRN